VTAFRVEVRQFCAEFVRDVVVEEQPHP
jgi:hypothetical protein